jgi:hypothetical protein
MSPFWLTMLPGVRTGAFSGPSSGHRCGRVLRASHSGRTGAGPDRTDFHATGPIDHGTFCVPFAGAAPDADVVAETFLT